MSPFVVALFCTLAGASTPKAVRRVTFDAAPVRSLTNNISDDRLLWYRQNPSVVNKVLHAIQNCFNENQLAISDPHLVEQLQEEATYFVLHATDVSNLEKMGQILFNALFEFDEDWRGLYLSLPQLMNFAADQIEEDGSISQFLKSKIAARVDDPQFPLYSSLIASME